MPTGLSATTRGKITHIVNIAAIEPNDDIAGLYRTIVHRTALYYTGDKRPLGLAHSQAFGNIIGNWLNADAKPTTSGLAKFAQLVDHIPAPVPKVWKNQCRSSLRTEK